MKKENLLPLMVVFFGATAGLTVSVLHLWDWIEPVIGLTTLGVAAGGWLRSFIVERKLGDVMEQKDFQVTFGLREGYLEGSPEHSFAEAESAYRVWMQKRVDGGQKFVTGLLDTMTLTFPVKGGEGKLRVTQEPGAILSGSLSPHYDKGRSDYEVVLTLKDLAQHLGAALGQTRVYVSYCGRQWTLEVNK